MPSKRRVERTLAYVARLCETLGVRWALAGGLAVNLYRDRPRLTQDVDVTLEIPEGRWPAVADRLRAEGWSLQPATPDPDVALLRHPDHLPVDVLLAKTDYQREALARAQPRRIGRTAAEVPVLTREDVVVHKLIAGRAVDIDDVERILAAGGALDLGYLDRWIGVWQLGERWAPLRARLRG